MRILSTSGKQSAFLYLYELTVLHCGLLLKEEIKHFSLVPNCVFSWVCERGFLHSAFQLKPSKLISFYSALLFTDAFLSKD